jgi:hypothetical protein
MFSIYRYHVKNGRYIGGDGALERAAAALSQVTTFCKALADCLAYP